MLSNHDSQIAAFLERLPVEGAVDDGVSPRVLFQGELILTREQEDRMIDFALLRKQQLSDELGREEVMEGTGIRVPVNGDIDSMKFLPKCALFESLFEQKLDWRRGEFGGIYAAGQNIHMPMLRRIANQMISRALNYFFGSDPWCSATPIGDADAEMAQNLDQFVKHKLKKGSVKDDLESAVKKAFVAGVQIVKTRHWTDAVFYETTATIALDAGTGQPLIAHDGDYIMEDDAWVDYAPQATAPPDGAPPVPAAASVKVLKRDPATAFPATGITWNRQRIRRKVVRYSGPEAKCVSRKDFLAPLDCEDLNLADCVVHLYDETALAIVNFYLTRLQKQGQFNEGEWPKVMDLLRSVSGESREPKAGALQPRQELGEEGQATPVQAGDPTFECGEFYLNYDANEDGQQESIQLVLDVKTMTPISYEHLPNVLLDARRPFHNVRVNPIEGRWTGMGVAEILYQLQRFIDLVVNRWDMSISTSGAVTFWAPTMTVQGAENPRLEVNGGKTYTKRDPKMRAEDIIEQVRLHEFKGGSLQEILEFGLQMMTNLLGVGNVNDAEMAGMDTAQLATGVRNMEKSGQEQFAPYISHLEKGLTSAAQAACKLAVWHMDPQEAFAVTENQSLEMLTVAAEALHALDFDVEMELTRYNEERDVTQSSFAVATIKAFYAEMLPFQQLLLPLYRKQLKAYGIKNPDKYLMPGMIVMPMMGAGMPAAPAPPPGGAQTTGSPPNL